jgi:hypothetical protein
MTRLGSIKACSKFELYPTLRYVLLVGDLNSHIPGFSVARERASSLKNCINKLFAATEAFVDDKRANGENFKADRKFGIDTRSTVAGMLDDEKNDLSTEIRKAVSAIEELLKPHLSRS